MANRDRAAEQLTEFKKLQPTPEQLTASSGTPLGNKLASMTVGPRGPIVIQDFALFDELAHFDHERIPERVVHAKGAGAHGYFEVTHDITKYCKAKVFEKVGKRTPLVVRCSTVGGESGSADTARDPRGFAMKFYTEDGNWDLVGNNTPIFFIRDPIFFANFIHTQKRNPKTHLKDMDMIWDFFTLRPETTHQVSFMYSDRGTPDGFRHMNGYGSHTFKLINAKDEAVYCKFHYKTDQGIKCLSAQKAGQLAGDDPDYATRDLYNAIEKGDFPSYTFHIQVMTFAQAETWKFNPFDLTKVWPHSEFPLQQVGKIVLNRNPTNYFNEVEQAAYSPAHMPPGIETSPDKMLQGRLFAYSDTHRHRLGPNYQQLPINRPVCPVFNYQKDGFMNLDNQAGAPVYYPNSFNGPIQDEKSLQCPYKVSGDVTRYNGDEEDNFTQVGIFWRKVLKEDERNRLVENIVSQLKDTKDFIQARAVHNFTQADPDYGKRVKEALIKASNRVHSTEM